MYNYYFRENKVRLNVVMCLFPSLNKFTYWFPHTDILIMLMMLKTSVA